MSCSPTRGPTATGAVGGSAMSKTLIAHGRPGRALHFGWLWRRAHGPNGRRRTAGLTAPVQGSGMVPVSRMRISAVLVALATFVSVPLPALADTGADTGLGFDLESVTIPVLQQRMDHGRLTSVQLTA